MKKVENFLSALENLKDIFVYNEPMKPVELTGCVGLYQICFEQAWKAIKEALQYYGYPESATDSPRAILKTAYEAGLISEETAWLNALADRNDSTHSYNKVIAIKIINNTKEIYYPLFQQLANRLKTDWRTE